MRKAVLAICVILTIAGVLCVGYRLAGSGPTLATRAEGTDIWPTDPVRLAVAVSDYPLFYETGDIYKGFFADLLEQVPMNEQQWAATTLEPDDALAAVAARSVDLALLAETRGSTTDGLTASSPLLSADVSLLSADAAPPVDGYDDKEVAWYGPDGIAGLVIRLGATPVPVLSASDCIHAAADRQAVACAIDENLGAATASLLGLQNLYFTGEALGSVEYRLVWATSRADVAVAVQSWLTTLQQNGVLSALQRKWLGVQVATPAPTGVPVLAAIVLGLGSAAGVLTSFGFAARYRGLRRVIRARQTEWRDSQARYRALLESTSDAIFVLDSDQSSIVQSNGRAEEITGYPGSELLKTHFHQLVPARQRRLLREWFLDSADGSRAEEIPLVRQDGSVATVELRMRSIESGGRTVRLCLVRDATQLKSLQREVLRARDVADRVLESTTNGVATVDADCVVTSCNRALLQAIDRDGDTVGAPLDAVIKAENQSLVDLVRLTLTEGSTQRGQISLLDTNGRPVPSTLIVSPLRDGQAVTGAALVFTSMSQEGRDRDEWQRLGMLSALGQVSGVLAHEIRGRVNSVLMGVQYLAEKLPPEDPRHKTMEYICSETDWVVQIVDDILMLIRPGRVDKTLCRVSDIVEGVVRSQAAYAFRRKVRVTASLTQEALLVRADMVQMERALSNLVKNAVEAAPSGSSVQVSADMVTHSADGKQGEVSPQRGSTGTVRVRVCDNGPGIPPGVRARLFQPYASEKEGGTGLGLSITKRIVDDHGGSIEVESREGHGTTFTVLLPAAGERET